MLSYLLDLVLYCLVSSINWVIKALGTLVGWIFNLLPTSPFVGYDASWFHGIKYIEYVEWIIPITAMLSLLTTFLVSVLGYYVVKWILQVIKLT